MEGAPHESVQCTYQVLITRHGACLLFEPRGCALRLDILCAETDDAKSQAATKGVKTAAVHLRSSQLRLPAAREQRCESASGGSYRLHW